MEFTQIRNATAKLKYGPLTIPIDPWQTDYESTPELEEKIAQKRFIGKPVKPLPFDPEKILQGTDALLITHLHEDHFSPDYLDKDMLILSQNSKDTQKLKELGFENVKTFENDVLELDGTKIRKVTAVHGDNPNLLKQMGEISGYVLEHPQEKTLYLVGDSIYDPIIQKQIEEFNPDVLVINACDARVSRGRLIMNEDDVLKLAKATPEKEIIVSHMDGVSHAYLSSDQLRSSLKENGLEHVLVPEDGQTLKLN